MNEPKSLSVFFSLWDRFLLIIPRLETGAACYGLVVRLHDGDLHAVGWDEGP